MKGMRKILAFISCVLLFTSCCGYGFLLRNNKGFNPYSFYINKKTECSIESEECSANKNHYIYKEYPNESRFKFRISIAYNWQSPVTLNDFRLTNFDGISIPTKYYVETYTKDTVTNKIIEKVWELDTLPVILREAGVGKAHCIYICAETIEPYSMMKKMKINYDFKVGEEHFISNNIKLKWRFYIDCQPRW